MNLTRAGYVFRYNCLITLSYVTRALHAELGLLMHDDWHRHNRQIADLLLFA